MKDYIRLLKFVRPHVGFFVLAVICMFFSALFDGVSLGMIVPLTDKVLTDKKIVIPADLPPFVTRFVSFINDLSPLTMLNYMAVSVIVLFLLKGLFNFLQSYFMSDIGQKVVRDVRNLLFNKLQALSLDFFIRKRGGELISRITNDVKLIENAVSYGSTDLFYQGLQVVLFMFIIFFIHAKMALTALVLLPLISIPIVKVGKKLRKLSGRSQETMADINSLLYEAILGTRIVKAFNMQKHEIDKFSRANQMYYRLSMKSIKRTLLLSPFTEFLGCLAGVFVLFWGGREVIAGKLSFGVFALFLGSLFSLIKPFKKLSQVNSINQQAIAAGNRIYEVLDATSSIEEKKDAIALQTFKTSVKFENVWFSYTDQYVLKGIDLEVKKGEILALVGPSGTGKTTLVDLIPRFYDPQKGKILIDGFDIRDATLMSLRQQVGIVTQETILFNDSIKSNISYGHPQAPEELIKEAARKAHAHDFIERLPEGYETIIGDRGAKLSGGERQRIAIARAILKNPPILILDEATSALDSESERIVQDALEKLIRGRTVFVIAHRLSTVKAAHRIIVLQHGKIIEQGTHSELLTRSGLYKKLYQMQEIE